MNGPGNNENIGYKVYHLVEHPFLVVNVFVYFYSGLYLSQGSD